MTAVLNSVQDPKQHQSLLCSDRVFFSENGPVADATDARQPWGLLCNRVMKMKREIISFFFVLPCNGAPVELNWQRKTEVLGRKPVPVQLCPSQIPHGLTRDRTRASAVRDRRLTAVAQFVEALRYKAEDRGFDSQWCHWHNSFGRTVALGSTQPLTELSTRNISWGVKAAGA
jgi:hypothetical protein